MDIVTHGKGGPAVVVIGAGFGGLHAARVLSNRDIDVTVIDRHNHHLFQPLLYQVATAALSPGEISYPVRSVFRNHKRTRTILAEVKSIDVESRRVALTDETIPYDYLVVATGATHSYFGHDAWERLAPGLKEIEDALEMRRRILLAFEKAEREKDAAKRQALLTFVIVGGGPTGVELAGAIAEIATRVLRDDFRSIDPVEARVVLVEAAPRILAGFPERLSEKAETALRELGCWVWTAQGVTDIQEDHVMIEGRRIEAFNTFWAAGVRASPLGKQVGAETDRAGRVMVRPELNTPGRPEIFVGGDLALLEEDGRAPPGIAPVALQQGRHAARNILRAIEGKPLKPFRYFDKGSMATIGRAKAVAKVGDLQLWGLVA